MADEKRYVASAEAQREAPLASHAQLQGYVVDHARSGGGRQCQHGRLKSGFLAQPRDVEIGRAEVVAPLRDAVCLVDHHERDLHRCQQSGEARRVEAFGSHVDQFDKPLAALLVGVVRLVGRHAAVDAAGRDVAAPQIVGLVLHQRYERSDDHGDAREHQRRHLERERLAAARRQQAYGVAAVEDRRDDFGLHRSEGIVAPVAPQHLLGRVAGMTRRGRGGTVGVVAEVVVAVRGDAGVRGE